MPMRLDEGWNQIQFNLADFTRRAYGVPYMLHLILCSIHVKLLSLLNKCMRALLTLYLGKQAYIKE